MKKSKYIGKYDYINYYTKPKGFWFFQNNEIMAAIKTELKFGENFNYDEDAFEDDDEYDSELDSYEFYSEQKEEYYLEEKELLKLMDDNNPLIVEGRIIDQKSKEFIVEKFGKNKIVIDFEDKQYSKYKNEEIAVFTKEKLLDENEYIFFQPVFILDNKITKPDAIIKNKNQDMILVETKGTTSCKFVHLLDVFFQKQVIENQPWLLDWTFDYELCLVKYEFKNKHEISFETTPYINCKKTVSTSTVDNKIKVMGYFTKYTKEVIEAKDKIKKGYDEKFGNNKYESCPIKMKTIMNDDLSMFDVIIDSGHPSSKKSAINSKKTVSEVINNFDNVVEELQNHKNTMNDNSRVTFEPSVNDKNPFKNSDLFPYQKKIYVNQGYNMYKYSGKVADINEENIKNVFKNEPIDLFIKVAKDKKATNPLFLVELFKSNEKVLVNKITANNLFNKLKPNKVYFDFETVNTAIRSADNSLPFSQIITQCSIIKNFGSKKNECENLIIDPQKINNQWYKDVVDALYEKEQEISYIVYNKSFESARLKEISYYLKDDKYTQKINHIINNIFDLADFFTLSISKGYTIFFKELYGFYSIKKVLPLIEKYAKHIFEQTKCKDYTTLEIGNGVECQSKTVLRFFNKVSDDEWKTLSKNMQVYCENDVRAMIAVEYFVKGLIDEKIKVE